MEHCNQRGCFFFFAIPLKNEIASTKLSRKKRRKKYESTRIQKKGQKYEKKKKTPKT